MPQTKHDRWPQQLGRSVVHCSQGQFCCVPRGCDRYRDDLISADDPQDAVKVLCNNDHCTESGWMHADCFHEWEQQILSSLRSSGRARSWNDKQRMQNIWTKKGYDLVFRICDCKCGKGHLRKDLEYVSPRQAEDNRRPNKKKGGKGQKLLIRPMPAFGGRHFANGASTHNSAPTGSYLESVLRPQLRVRTNSLSSTGSSSCSPPSSAGTPPETPGSAGIKKKFNFFENAVQAAHGNIFQRRTDYSAFKHVLPRHQQNPYHIKMEDEGPHGNDETRCFVLTNLSSHHVTSVACVVCSAKMPVFDKYPLIDGTFFLSPQRYNTDLQVLSEHRMLYLNAICMGCLQGQRLCCLACRTPWIGSAYVIGSMYAYDVFAAIPCCAQRLSCKNCSKPVLEPGAAFNFFSQYSRSVRCPHCQTDDYHFIKPLEQIYTIV